MHGVANIQEGVTTWGSMLGVAQQQNYMKEIYGTLGAGPLYNEIDLALSVGGFGFAKYTSATLRLPAEYPTGSLGSPVLTKDTVSAYGQYAGTMGLVDISNIVKGGMEFDIEEDENLK